MNFNQKIKEIIFPVLQSYQFKIAEEYNNIIRFKSYKIKINMVFNEFEKSYFVEIGKINETLFPLSDEIIKNVFKNYRLIQNLPIDTFIENLIFLFGQKEGIKLLSGNIHRFEVASKIENNNYNSELIQKQMLSLASQAWENKDYQLFVDVIKDNNIEMLPESYKLKYEIACKKVYR